MRDVWGFEPVATSSSVDMALRDAQSALRRFAAEGDFGAKMEMAFGNGIDRAKAGVLAQAWAAGDFSAFPAIEIRDSAEINGARGAFARATNKIYLSRELVSAGDVGAISSVLLEEYGHYIDSQVNSGDAPGDEGEIFAGLAQGKELSQAEFSALKGEDDGAVVILDGEVVRVEQAEFRIEQDILEFKAKDIAKNNIPEIPRRELLPNLPEFELKASGSVPGQLLKFDANIDISAKIIPYAERLKIGEPEFDYPINISVALPTQISKGETSYISVPGYSLQGNPEIKALRLELGTIDIVLKSFVGESGVKNITFTNPLTGKIETADDIIIPSRPPDERTLLTISQGDIKANVDFITNPDPRFGDAILSGDIKLPNSFDGKATEVKSFFEFGAKLPSIEGTLRTDNFAELEADIDELIAFRFPFLNPFFGLNKELKLEPFGKEGPRIGAKFSYDLVDIKADLGFGLQQDTTFIPDPTAPVRVTMSADGNPLSLKDQPGKTEGTLGDEFEIKAPSEGCGVLKVKAKYELQGKVKNEIGVVPQLLGKIDGLKYGVSVIAGGKVFDKDITLNQELSGRLISPKETGVKLPIIIPPNGVAFTDPYRLIGPDGVVKLDPISTNDIDGIELDENNSQENATKNLIIEKEYEIPYNLPITVSEARVTEGTGGTTNSVFTVSRREASNESLILEYSTTDGSATAGTDYFQATNRRVVIPAGQISADITIPVIGDTDKEGAETFTVTVKDPSGKVFAECKDVDSVSATGTIIDDDEKPEPPQPEDTGDSHNDPRLVTFDKQYYDFQAAGEFIFVQSTTGDLKIQVRQQPVNNDPLTNVSINTAVATVLGGKRIGLYKDNQIPLLVDGQATEIADNSYIAIGDGRIYREGNTYTLVYANGEQLVAKVRPKNRIDIKVFLAQEREGKVVGLLGNNNNDPKDDLAKRDGTVLAQPVTIEQLYGEYADSWRITQAESLFDYQPGQNTNTFTLPNYPRQKVTLGDLNPADVEKAYQLIGERINLINPNLLEGAIIDFILTGFDDSIIERAIEAEAPESSLSIVIPAQASDDFAGTTANTPVTVDVLSNDTGTLGTPLSIANFDQTTTAGGKIATNNNNTPDDKTDDRLIYTPPANFTGTDSFNYTLSDGTQTSTAKVTVTVPALNLSTLNGSNGFVLNGVKGDFSGVSVSKIGDFNGDKIDDLIVGAFAADPNGTNAAGNSYVVFGKKAGLPASVDLSTLNGSNGFALNGVDAEGFSGGAVSGAGDINGDGFNDLIIGAFGAAVDGKNNAGKAYVVFGTNQPLPANFSLASLNPSTGETPVRGFAITGTNEFDYLGYSVSGAGDINNDGFDDLAVSAAGPLGGNGGKTYIIYGRSEGFPAGINLAQINGSTGFAIQNSNGSSGISVSAAGDINGDGIADLIVGTETDTTGSGTPGETYVVFGSASGFPDSLNLSQLNGSNGFTIAGIEANSGTTVSKAGDINGDGTDDLIVAVSDADSSARKSYAVLGSNKGFSARLDLSQLKGNNGFALLNSTDGLSVSSVSAGGDINGDGIDDLIVGVSLATPNGKSAAGKSYVLFGSNGGFPGVFNLSKLNGNNGFALNGVEADDLSGTSVSEAGDINGDGVGDLIVGSPGSLFNDSAGKSYVVFGNTGFGNNDPSNLAKVLFKPSFYLSSNPGVAEEVAGGEFRTAFQQFIEEGFRDGREPSPVFATDYLNQNPDVRDAVADGTFRSGFEHFLKYGFAENRQPSSLFGSFPLLEVFYLSENPDVAQAVQRGEYSSGLEHLIRYGMAEGRDPFPRFAAVSETFDSDFYLAENPDVAEAVKKGIFRTGFEHFVKFGLFEGRDPSNEFNNSSYLSENPDVAEAVRKGDSRSGFEHFMKYGFWEERNAFAVGDEFADGIPQPLARAIMPEDAGSPTLTGSGEADILTGDAGDNILNGDLGDDTLTGSTGSDIFVLQKGAGSDTITDYQDGTDFLGLAGGLTFEQLAIAQGAGATLISFNGELLASLTGVEANSIGREDFTLI